MSYQGAVGSEEAHSVRSELGPAQFPRELRDIQPIHLNPSMRTRQDRKHLEVIKGADNHPQT